jgi:iron complex transport system permease protein
VALVFGAGTRLGGLWGTGAAACVGAAATGLLVYALARRDGRVGVEDLLLIGLATSGVAGAGTTWLLLRAGTMEGRVLLGWLSGSLAWRDWSFVAVLLPVTVAGLGLAWAGRRGLDLLSCGEETATCLGLETERAKTGFLLVAALLAGGAAAVAGPIPFVGLMTPHLVRGLTGGPHGRLLPGCALGGGLLLLLADGVARMASPGEELPVGLVTSLLGGLFFLALARRRLARPPG